MAKLTDHQLAALEKLADGEFHPLVSLTAKMRAWLYERGLIEDRGPRGKITRSDGGDPRRAREYIGSAALEYRITESGRAELAKQMVTA